MNKINTKNMYHFLKDFETQSKTYVLSESKTDKEKKLRKELLDVAMAKGIIVENSRDLAVFKTVYTFADKKNGNEDLMQEDEVLRAMPTIVGKSINIDHISRYVVGYYIDYKYIEKTKTVIAYGIFFKSVFDKEYEEAKELLEAGVLATSHEVWHDEDKLEVLDDGTNVLHDLQFAGGALVMHDTPAFKGTTVLAISTKVKKVMDNIKTNIDDLQKQPQKYSMAYSSLTKESKKRLSSVRDKILTASNLQTTIDEVKKPTSGEVVCQGCSKNFTHQFIEGSVNQIKCPSCYSIVNNLGEIIYPPQTLDFDLTCEKCKSRNNWLIKKDDVKEALISCNSCQEEFNVSFSETTEHMKLIRKISWLKQATYNCLQCNEPLEYCGPSTIKQISMKCKGCGLTRVVDLLGAAYKRKISEIKIVKIEIPAEKEPEIIDVKLIEKNKIGGEREMDKLVVAKLLRKAVAKINALKSEQVKSVASLNKQTEKGGKYLAGAKKFSNKIKELKNEIKVKESKILSTIQEAEKEKDFYMSQATELQKRKSTLEDFSHGYSDVELMDNVKYELAISKLKISKQDIEIEAIKQKKVILNVATQKVTDENVGTKLREDAARVNLHAFGPAKK